MDRRLRYLPALRSFEAAARHQSYSRAAEELSITQAAVSQQVRNLEDHFRVKLFYRVGRQMKLTQQGRTLAEYVSRAFGELSEGFDRISTEPEDGVLTVTAPPSFSSYWLVPRLWRFSVKHPNINVRAVASTQLEDLKHSDIDIAIRQYDDPSDDNAGDLLFDDPVYPYCTPDLVTQMNLTSPEKLMDCWLVQPIDSGRFNWERWFKHVGVDTKKTKLSWIEVTTWEMGINAVMSGHGVCLAASSIAEELVRRGVLVCPFEISIEPGVRFSLLHEDNSPKLARINTFREWLKEEVKMSSPNPQPLKPPTG